MKACFDILAELSTQRKNRVYSYQADVELHGAEYLAQHGTPRTPANLARHYCISIHHGNDAYACGVSPLHAGPSR